MTSKSLKLLASICLVVGGALGVAGTFAPSDALRGLAWGVDGVSLVIAGSMLTLIFFRLGLDLVAAGFLVFTVGQGLILSTAPMSLTAGVPAFGSGVALWTAGLVLISLPKVFPLAVRLLGLIAAILFAIVAIRVLLGDEVLATTSPLPFFAYPILVATMVGWIWTLRNGVEVGARDD
jgi:hypothetical protein